MCAVTEEQTSSLMSVTWQAASGRTCWRAATLSGGKRKEHQVAGGDVELTFDCETQNNLHQDDRLLQEELKASVLVSVCLIRPLLNSESQEKHQGASEQIT